jgi:MerR family copper efflux transcriptional regulator
MVYFNIGELANKSDVSKVAIRYYERCGLLPKAGRNKSGYRIYPDSIISRVHFIKNAQSVGFTLEEIGELLILQERAGTTSQQIKSSTLDKLKTIYEKITSLQQMADTLKKLVTACDGKVPLSDCPILRGLYGNLEA